MPEGPAVDSFRYALNQELLKLYTAIFAGYVVVQQAVYWGQFFDFPEPLQTLVELPFLLIGFGLIVGRFIGSIHRILEDTVSTDQ
jgi:hypothetical protein